MRQRPIADFSIGASTHRGATTTELNALLELRRVTGEGSPRNVANDEGDSCNDVTDSFFDVSWMGRIRGHKRKLFLTVVNSDIFRLRTLSER